MKMKKNLNIEYMRAIACLGVILIHIMKSAHDVFDNMTPEIYFICTSFVNNLRWCVPVFLMISGYLLLDPEKKIGLIKIKQYIIRIVIVLGIFGTGFAFIELISKKHSVCFTFIFRAFVNMLMGNTWNHLWYLYALIALYLFLPMLKSITGYLSKQEITYIIIVFLIYSSVFPTLKELGVTIGIAYLLNSINKRIMEEKLVTLAILTYTKAQILKNVLENEGIETYIHNVNQIQPVVSSGVRLRIKESDLPRALKITESSAWLAESIVGEKTPKVEHRTKKVLIPVDFSNYSMKACEFGFNFAKSFDAEVILLHVYFTPIYASSLPYGDVFNYQISDEETVKNVLHKVHDDLNTLSEKIKQKVASGEFPDVKYTCVLREGIPEEEILRYNKEHRPRIIIMGTRGKNQKDIDLIGSVTAEIIERSHTTVLAIPEKTPFNRFNEVKRIAFMTNFDQRDLIAFDSFINGLSPFHFSVSLIHLSDVKDTWNEIKLAGIKDYFQKQYPDLEIHYDVVMSNDFLNSLDNYIKTNQIDIITLTSYKRNIFSRLFNPGIARKMIFHSDTPLLVING